MLWKIKATEDLSSGDFVEFVVTDINGKLSCKDAIKPESITAMTARNIVEGEMLSFDTERDTKDLKRLREPFSRT
jgi:hypothetical protein